MLIDYSAHQFSFITVINFIIANKDVNSCDSSYIQTDIQTYSSDVMRVCRASKAVERLTKPESRYKVRAAVELSV